MNRRYLYSGKSETACLRQEVGRRAGIWPVMRFSQTGLYDTTGPIELRYDGPWLGPR